MIKHVAWLIFTNCIFFCPVAFFSFAPLITAISISPEIMKSVTLIFFPLPACLNPVLYVFFNPKFKEDWKLLKRRVTRKHGSVSVSISSQGGCGEQDFYYDCGMYSHLQGNLTVCDCCESFLLTKPVSCKHLIKSHSCPVLTVASCQRPEGYWSDCGTQSAHSDYADEEDSFVSDSSDQVQACGRACFYQSRGFPLVRYAYNLPRVRDWTTVSDRSPPLTPNQIAALARRVSCLSFDLSSGKHFCNHCLESLRRGGRTVAVYFSNQTFVKNGCLHYMLLEKELPCPGDVWSIWNQYNFKMIWYMA